MATTEDRLMSLEATVRLLQQTVAALIGGGVVPRASAGPAQPVDLDSEYGNPVMKKDPPRWKGESCVGKKFSECPPDYLENLAGLREWQAEKNEADPAKAKFAGNDRKDAARARGWAARLRASPLAGSRASARANAQQADPQQADPLGDELPF